MNKEFTMPTENAAIVSALETISKEICSFHNDFKQSFHFLINAINLNLNHEAENDTPVAPTPTVSQLDLFPTQRSQNTQERETSIPRPTGRANFQFPSDEQSSETNFEAKVSQCINQVSAE